MADRTRMAASLAWSLWILSVASVSFGLFFLYLNGSFKNLLEMSLGIDAVVALSFPTVGAIIASRRPDNVVGWIFCAIGLCAGIEVLTVEYGIYALVTNPGALPAGVIATWTGTWVWLPSVTLTTTFLLLLFPHGRLLSPRWRPVAWLAAGGTVGGVVLLALTPWDLLETNVPAENPFGIEGLRDVGVAVPTPIFVIGIPTILLCVASLVLSFQRSRGEERQQLKWFVYASVLVAGVLFVPLLVPGVASSLLQLLVMPSLPVAAGVAILRYRLYDIDVVINRTLVYGALTLMLAAVYLGGVTLLQGVLRTFTGQESQLAVVASTLTIAAMFSPLRWRIQSFIDRRFYRRKYDAQKTLEAFSIRLRDETDLASLTGELEDVVRETMQPEHATLWLQASSSGAPDQNPVRSPKTDG